MFAKLIKFASIPRLIRRSILRRLAYGEMDPLERADVDGRGEKECCMGPFVDGTAVGGAGLEDTSATPTVDVF